MNNTTFFIGLLFFCSFISAFSQILLKKSALHTYSSFIREYLNIYVISAYSIYFIAVCMDLWALHKVPVSYVPIIEASSYVYVIFLSRVFLKEKFSKRKIIGMSIIVLGIILYIV
ncbi:MAG: triose-phosphate transporter family protein [Treponema sp.]|nr:triose-phosphate transporter family protein [Treponema sp.]